MNDNKKDPQVTSERYISFLWWTSFILTMILYAGAFVATVRCYLPYSFDGAVPYEMRVLIFSLISACSVLIVFSMLLSHVLKRKLSDIAMIGIIALAAMMVASPKMLELMEWRQASYIISAYVFFMLPLSLTFIFASFASEKKNRLIGRFVSVISALMMLLMLAITLYVSIKEPVFDFLCSIMLLPVISVVTVFMSFGVVFGGCLNGFSLIRQFVLLALTSIISCFSTAGLAHIAFTTVLGICAVMLCFDIVYEAVAARRIKNINSRKEQL